MQNAWRWAKLFAAGLVGFSAAFWLGCPAQSVTTNTPDAGDAGPSTVSCTEDVTRCHCNVKEDCGARRSDGCFSYICTPAHQCVSICCTTADCNTGEVCDGALCRLGGCNGPLDCPQGSYCVDGTCTTAVPSQAVAQCVIAPAQALMHVGAPKAFSVISRDAEGKVLPYVSAVTWKLTGDIGTVTPDSNVPSIAAVTGSASAGTAQLTATIGTTVCTPASITNFTAPASDQFRVVVASQADHSLLSDATVVVNDDSQSSGSNGAYTFQHVTTPATVSVFKDGYTYVTLLSVTSNDVVVFLKPTVPPGKATGTLTADSFNGVSDIRGTVHLSMAGASLQGNLYDYDLSLLLGDRVPTHIDLGGNTQTDVNLPQGLAVGLGSQMFKSDYAVRAEPGEHAVWALGGNAVLSDVLSVETSVGGPDVEIASTLAALLPVIGRFESGVIPGQQFTSGTSSTLDMKLDTLLRLQAVAALPTLPVVAGHMNGALVLGGALSPSDGFVPLGLTAGVDRYTGSDAANMTPDGLIDPAGMGATPGQLPLRLAPLHSGLEGAPYELIAIEMDSAILLGKAPVRLSGRVLPVPEILFKNNGQSANTFQFSSFLPLPDAASLDADSRTLTVSATGADLYRVDFDGWQVYSPPTATIALPTPPSGFEDRLSTKATLRTVSLKQRSGVDYQRAVQFDGTDLDDLSPAMDAFTVYKL